MSAGKESSASGSVEDKEHSGSRRRRRGLVIGLLVVVVAVLLVILVPVGVLVIGRKHGPSSTATGDSTPTSGATNGGFTSAGSTSAVSTNPIGYGGKFQVPPSAKGTRLDPATWYDRRDFNLTYTNQTSGGLPVMGLNATWDDSARANPTVPALNEPWDYDRRPMRGVNLGGWLVLEPFITPSFFSSYPFRDGIVDEYTLSKKLGSNATSFLETHYSGFVEESTFAEIAAAGLDHVRIPYPYWAVAPNTTLPYVPYVSWRYLLRSIEWARKYGLRVNLDLHTVPGGQNGWNHSGRQGVIQWLLGTTGEYNGNLTLAIHKQLSIFFSQPRYKNVIQLYGLVNEPNMMVLQPTTVIDWTKQAYEVVRSNGFTKTIVFGEGFYGLSSWVGIFPNATYPGMMMDAHQYLIFNAGQIAQSHTGKLQFACSGWATQINMSMSPATGFGPTMVGEWGNADTDCALYLNNVGTGSRWMGDFEPDPSKPATAVLTQSCPQPGSCVCDPANAAPSNYTAAYRNFLLSFAEAQMETFEFGRGFYFWTWDTENATQWSYKKGRGAGILPQTAYRRNFTCAQAVPDYHSLGLPETF